MLRRAGCCKDAALLGSFFSAQNSAAIAGLSVRHWQVIDTETRLGIECSHELPQAKRTPGQRAQTTPLEGFAQLEDLVDDCLRLGVSRCRNSPGKFIFHF